MRKWKLLKSKPVFESKWLTLFDNTYELSNGKIGENYYHINRPDLVVIVASDDKDRIALIKQYRRGVDDFIYEFPAGWVEKDESPIIAGIRELKEETGYIGEPIVNKAFELYYTPGFASTKGYVVLLKINSKMANTQNLSHDEEIEYELIQDKDIEKLILNNEIKDMALIAAFNVYLLNKRKIF